jgi:hypothetical protein
MLFCFGFGFEELVQCSLASAKGDDGKSSEKSREGASLAR